MKSEERHQLEQNELAAWVAKTGATLKPYTSLIAAVAVLIVVAFFVTKYYSRAANQADEDAWNAFFAADSVDGFEQVAIGYPDSPAAAYARLRAADLAFRQGKTLLTSDPGKAAEKLNQAVEFYARLADDPNVAPLVAQQAAYGVGLAEETKGALRKAKDAYERVVKAYPDTALATRAKQRIEQIETPAAREFYDQLASYTPPKTDTKLPNLGSEGMPDLDVPLPAPEAGTTAPGEPKVGVPAPPVKSKPETPKAAAPEKSKAEENGAESDKPAKGEAQDEPKAKTGGEPKASDAGETPTDAPPKTAAKPKGD